MSATPRSGTSLEAVEVFRKQIKDSRSAIPRLSFKCAECGSGKLRLTGFEMLSVAICFDALFEGTGTGPTDWTVDYTLPKDGPRAFITCDKCRCEVKVSCRNEATGRQVVLWPAQVYHLLTGRLAIRGIFEEEAFKGKVEIKWKRFCADLLFAHPLLGKPRNKARGAREKK